MNYQTNRLANGFIASWIILLMFLPLSLIILLSFFENNIAGMPIAHLSLRQYGTLINSIYFKIFVKSFYLAGLCTVICLCLAYPFAYIVARIESHWKQFLLLLVIIPFWTSSLIRSYAIMSLLKAKGLMNTFLISIGLIHQPLSILFSDTAVLIGLVYNLLPFMILALYVSIERIDKNLIEAATDLGASQYFLFSKVIIPLSYPGIIAGCILVFLPATSLFYIPELLGGSKSMLLGNLLENQLLLLNNWPFSAAISVSLLLILGLMLLVYKIVNKDEEYHLV